MVSVLEVVTVFSVGSVEVAMVVLMLTKVVVFLMGLGVVFRVVLLGVLVGADGYFAIVCWS